MPRIDLEIFLLALLPWILGFVFYFYAPDLYGSVLQERGALLFIPLALFWQGAGIFISRRILQKQDPHRRLKLIFILILFFLPVLYLVILGPALHTLHRTLLF